MSDSGHSTVLTAPKPRTDRSSARWAAAPENSVSTRLSGVLDGRNRARVDATVAAWCQVAPLVRHSSLAHLDLSEVTALEPDGLDVLNTAYARLNAAGWRFRVTPPVELEPRLAFTGAAIRRALAWA